MWTLVVVAITGTFTADVKFHNIPMLNKEACVNAAKQAADSSSSHMGYICVSSETGETIKFGKSK
jgi:hypothetical protein